MKRYTQLILITSLVVCGRPGPVATVTLINVGLVRDDVLWHQMLRGISTLISHKRKVLVRSGPFIVTRGGARVTDEIPHVPKQVYTQLAGHINNFNLRVGVVYVVAQRPGDGGITRRFIPLHGASEPDVVSEQQ
jgi:hypothetical protein